MRRMEAYQDVQMVKFRSILDRYSRVGSSRLKRRSYSYSPKARGRPERLFHTLQDRLVKDPALARTAEVEAANRFIRAVYNPSHNGQVCGEGGAGGVGVRCYSRCRPE